MLFRTQLSIICVESFFQNHNIFMIMVISGGHYESGVFLTLLAQEWCIGIANWDRKDLVSALRDLGLA